MLNGVSLVFLLVITNQSLFSSFQILVIKNWHVDSSVPDLDLQQITEKEKSEFAKQENTETDKFQALLVMYMWM